MQILSRRIGERLFVGDDISIAILGIQGNQVCLGIEGPKYVAVHREEIYKKLCDEGFEEIRWHCRRKISMA